MKFKCEFKFEGGSTVLKSLNTAANFIQDNIAYVMCVLILYTIFCAVDNSLFISVYTWKFTTCYIVLFIFNTDFVPFCNKFTAMLCP
jgi:hypothetical protein